MTHVPSTSADRAPTAARRARRSAAAPVRANSRPSCATRVCVRPCSACLCAGCCLQWRPPCQRRALHAEAREAGLRMSLSTVYNALNQFAGAGLLREIAVQGRAPISTPALAASSFHGRKHRPHVRRGGRLGRIRAPAGAARGMEIVGCDVIIRLRKKKR